MQSVLEHLQQRRLDTSLHHVWVDEFNRVAVFPLWNLSGQMVGYHQYRPDKDKNLPNHPYEGRYFTRTTSHCEKQKNVKQHREVAVWGLESWNFSNVLFVCEGLFDASTIAYVGYSSIATFGSSLSASTANWLQLVSRFRPVVALRDNDEAGLLLSTTSPSVLVSDQYKDVGDTPTEVLKDFLKNYK